MASPPPNYSITSSFCDKSPLLSEDTRSAVQKLVQDLHASTDVLYSIADAMIQDFSEGLAHDFVAYPAGPKGNDCPVDPSRLPLMMLPSHVDRMPSGKEQGTYLAIDLGGTNLRVCAITLISGGNPAPITTEEEIAQAEADAERPERASTSNANGSATSTPSLSTIEGLNHRCVQAHYRIPDNVKTTGSLETLADFIAETVCSFLVEHNKDAASRAPTSTASPTVKPLIPALGISRDFVDGPMPDSMGFTFSFPVCQHSLLQSSLLAWTKGFSIPDAVGRDVAGAVQTALVRRGLQIRINALINDTVGTLLAHAYDSPTARIGIILGTGTNAAYLERRANIKKLDQEDSTPNVPASNAEPSNITVSNNHEEDLMIVNTEWGAFNKIFDYLPRTAADIIIDESSLNPGRQWFEKMISGMYLGEVLAKSLLGLIDNPDVCFLADTAAAAVKAFSNRVSIPTKYLQWIEAKDEACRPAEARRILIQMVGLPQVSERDSLIFCEVLTAVRRRAARLSAAAIYALLRQMGLPRPDKPVAVAIDGTLWLKYPNFKNTILVTLAELLKPEEFKLVSLEKARDGSGMGAAVVAALYSDRNKTA